MSEITKQSLRLGNLFKEGVVCKINGRAGAKVHVCGRLEYKDGKLKNRTEVPAESLTPIPLSPQVLVEWLGAEELGKSKSHTGYKVGELVIMLWSDCVCVDLGQFEPHINYVHELQNLHYILAGKELEIKE